MAATLSRISAQRVLHTSRGSRISTLDRYSAIRSFFRQQSTSSSLLKNGSFFHAKAVSNIYHARYFSATYARTNENSSLQKEKDRSTQSQNTKQDGTSPGKVPAGFRQLDNYPRLFRRLAMTLPDLHRASRDDYLNAANGFWQRARVRFKWLTIRSFRKYNADDISAFVTWFFMSQTLWLLVGTTTFFSVVFATINSLRLQGYVARAISDYLTSETGITIIFESAVVPKWKDSRISFKNVFVTRRPSGTSTFDRLKAGRDVGHNAAGFDIGNQLPYHRFEDDDQPSDVKDHSSVDNNYAIFDLNVDSIDVTLSLTRWLDGKGLIEDAVVKGVRGVLDRRSVVWDPDHPLDPASFRREARIGDFELESLQLEDVLITVCQPGDFRPYTASIFRADMRCFRKQWMFYDFLSAENIVGQVDNCLFSLHKPQSIGRTTEQELKDGQWARMSRFRMDGLNVDHMQAMTTQEGPISWITSGKVDAVLDIKFPRDPHDMRFDAFLGEIADAITTAATSAVTDRIPGQRELAKPPLSAPEDIAAERADVPQVVVDIDLRFRDLKAAVPIFTNDLSYVNNALIRPIVAFMNANRTLVPIHCRVVRDLSDFDGAWTMWETGLMDAVALKVYEAMAYHVTQANFNRRVRAVSAWSLQRTASAVAVAVRAMADPMAAHLRAS